ncbi:MAG: GNAT family N-acetyltransferase [Thermoproteota archaeon]|nr:GNAT family N-acetyltransferase [Thermoproteota archaeon]
MDFVLRELKEEDLEKGFFDTLSNLTTVGKISQEGERAKSIFNEISKTNMYKIVIAEDTITNQVIGTATLLIEQKFIHDGGKVGHIEDVSTRKEYQGKGVGAKIIRELIKIGKENGCYKIILDCDEKVIRFYEKLGFRQHSTMMRIDT